MSTEPRMQLVDEAAHIPVSDEVESDDNLVRTWQDEIREAQEKIDVYRSDHGVAATFDADVRHTRQVLADRPLRILQRRAEIAYEQWAQLNLAGLTEIPVMSKDRTFASVKKEYLSVLAPELADAIPRKSHLWTDWSVWNFKRKALRRSKALPAEAVRRARSSLAAFERVEVWQAVGMADPWLVGVVRMPAGRERFYLLFDWGLEGTMGRDSLR